MATKQDVITELFERCKRQKAFGFDNTLVKQICQDYGFRNPFDATKLDDTSKFPQILLDEDYFILHLGCGRHRFVKGMNNGFHCFEEIHKDDMLDWKYRKSLLNEFDTSESNILSVASNQRIIHEFLYEHIVANPKVYNARRTKMNLSYSVPQKQVVRDSLQTEKRLLLGCPSNRKR